MKTSHKTWCQPISARKLTSKKMWLPKTELAISEISEFSILALYWNRKLRKLGNISNTCKFQRMCFTWGSWKFPRFPSFWFWPLWWNWKLGKLGNIYNTCKFWGMYLKKLEICEVCEFSMLALILKSKTWKTRKYLQHL